jgi:hypothetical protein
MKFTEEQYQKIVEIADDFEENGGLGILDTLNSHTIGDRLFLTDLAVEIEFQPNSGIIMAIANPLTREWAHDKFVEKEKRYYWTGNKVDNAGFVKRLYKDDDGMIVDHGFRKEDKDKGEDEQLTESEIKSWGYNPEMFDREEVK